MRRYTEDVCSNDRSIYSIPFPRYLSLFPSFHLLPAFRVRSKVEGKIPRLTDPEALRDGSQPAFRQRDQCAAPRPRRAELKITRPDCGVQPKPAEEDDDRHFGVNHDPGPKAKEQPEGRTMPKTKLSVIENDQPNPSGRYDKTEYGMSQRRSRRPWRANVHAPTRKTHSDAGGIRGVPAFAKEYNLNPLKGNLRLCGQEAAIVPIGTGEDGTISSTLRANVMAWSSTWSISNDGKTAYFLQLPMLLPQGPIATNHRYEYFAECYAITIPWKMKPRMLRHKSFIRRHA